MITDRENTFSIKQAVTATAVSTDSVLINSRNLSRAHAMRIYVEVAQTFTAAGAATLSVDIIQADDAALTTNVEVLHSSPAPIALANLALTTNAANRIIDTPMPRTSKQYLGLRYNVATGPFTAGQVTGGIVEASDSALNTRPPYWTGL